MFLLTNPDSTHIVMFFVDRFLEIELKKYWNKCMNIKNILTLFSVAIFSGFPLTSNAAIHSCGMQTINNFYVQGDRDDGYDHANKVVVILNSDCNGKTQAYIENAHPAFQGILSTLHTAFVAGHQVHLYINTSKAAGDAFQISLLQVVK